jgi:hypothetical protein
MKLRSFSQFLFALALSLAFLPSRSVQAGVLSSLTLVAHIEPSATLVISDNAGPINTLHFDGSRNEELSPNEGSITVAACVSTLPGNSDTIIQVKCSDLLGSAEGDSIPAADVTCTHTDDTGGGSWYSGPLSNTWITVAKLTPGSGVYTSDQTIKLAVPANANYDTYIGTVTYQIVGF